MELSITHGLLIEGRLPWPIRGGDGHTRQTRERKLAKPALALSPKVVRSKNILRFIIIIYSNIAYIIF